MMADTLAQWRSLGPRPDLWVFAYASLVWRPEFAAAEQRLARVHGHHRCLEMWSRVNRGTFECPGLVFALMPGGSCTGLALRVPHDEVEALMPLLWAREMPNPVYDPKWLTCQTDQGPVHALAFTLSRRSPSHTGTLSEER
ncbi:MAG: gamma-glutamylcyclotransferase, partial [Hydrogenophaga sp.]